MGFLSWLFRKSESVSKVGPAEKYDELVNEGKQDEFVSEEDRRREIKQKGDEFEKYIMRKLSQNKYFTVKEATSDKGFDVGVYVEANVHPDFVVEFNWKEKKINKLFAVECKWRQSLFSGYFCWASLNQIQRYEKFSSERQMPVFLALGLGGSPSDPEKFYIIPLDDVRGDVKEFQGRKQGAIYFKKLNNPKLNYLKLKESVFFFDFETGTLR